MIASDTVRESVCLHSIKKYVKNSLCTVVVAGLDCCDETGISIYETMKDDFPPN
jgi:hypothetical protein